MEKENKTVVFLQRLGIVRFILLWLAIEYVAFLSGKNFFLGAILADTEWTRWSQYTGVAGISLWLLISGWFLYLGLFRKWQYTLVFVIVIVAPILYSYTLPTVTIEPENEWVARTAAWISVLILLSTVVKEFTRKK